MASVTLPRRAHNLHLIREHRNNRHYDTDDEETNSIISNNYHLFSNYSKITKPTKALSYEESGVQTSSINNNRLKDLCSRVKRRLTLTKEHRTCSEDINRNGRFEHRINNSNHYQSFSSSADDSINEFEWPDFEKIYDSIPPCLINALPGLDDFSMEENYKYSLEKFNLSTNETNQYSIEQINLFLQCKRGKNFRRNGICRKLDKTQYKGQLDTFIQQLMVEKLIRTWT